MSDTSGLNFIDFLAYGAIGIALALAILSYRLLSKEQQREEVRDPMLKSIRNYFIMSIVLSLFFGTGEIISMLSDDGGGKGEEATIAELWDMHVAEHDEPDHKQRTVQQKKSKMLELMRVARFHPDNLKKIQQLNDSIDDLLSQLKAPATSFYGNFEKFRSAYGKAVAMNERAVKQGRSWVYLDLVNPDHDELYPSLKRVLFSMGRDVGSGSKMELLTVWMSLKKKWDGREQEKRLLDHIELSDLTQLVRLYLDKQDD